MRDTKAVCWDMLLNSFQSQRGIDVALEHKKGNQVATFSAAAIGFSVLFLAAFLLTPLKESFQRPDYNQMKRHILTDAVLQKLEEIRHQQQNEYMRKFSCDLNVAFQISGSKPCSKDLANSEIFFRSDNDVFELWLLRHCELTKTVREAKKLGCLPQ